jgi:hypothetical protein
MEGSIGEPWVPQRVKGLQALCSHDVEEHIGHTGSVVWTITP